MCIKNFYFTLLHYRLSSFGRRAFSVAGPVTRNFLLDSLYDSVLSCDGFRRPLKMQLFTVYVPYSAVEIIIVTLRYVNV